MRILFLVSDYPTVAFPNVGVFHRNSVEALLRCGAEVQVMVLAPWLPAGLAYVSARARRRQTEYRSRFCGAAAVWRCHYLRLPGSWHLPYCMAAAVRRNIKQRPDVIHSHHGFTAGLTGARVARRLGIPSVLTLHGSDINCDPLVSAKFKRWTMAAVYANHVVVAVSEALRARTHELFGRWPLHLPIGVNLRSYQNLPTQADARRQLGLPLDRKLLLYVGDLTHSKGIVELMQAIQAVAVHGGWGVVVGSGPQEALVQNTPHCTFCGRQPNEKIPLYMRAADAFILASHAEGLPTVLVEAGAAKTPVIATSVGGIPELLGLDRGCLVAPRSVDALAQAMERVMHNPSDAMERAVRLHQYVHEHYDVDLNARRLMGIYQDILNKHPLGVAGTN